MIILEEVALSLSWVYGGGVQSSGASVSCSRRYGSKRNPSSWFLVFLTNRKDYEHFICRMVFSVGVFVAGVLALVFWVKVAQFLSRRWG